ncbi:pyruvate kinase [Escherichia coli]|uniref:Pyruvate kinase n=1 Tax=Escherichia coli TaxID=562 RepID=A0A377BA56_ECOLX|nr:pyruvate kinase [Escherichia coli]
MVLTAVMLSAETAAGSIRQKPLQPWRAFAWVRKKIPSINVSKHRLDVQFDNVEEAIAMSAMYAANHLKGVTAIITMTGIGSYRADDLPYQLWSTNFRHVAP